MTNKDLSWLKPKKPSFKDKIKRYLTILFFTATVLVGAVVVGQLKYDCESKGGHLVNDIHGFYVCTE